METLDLLIKLWPLLTAVFTGSAVALVTHFKQKGRIDILEEKVKNQDLIIEHVINEGKDIKKEQEILKITLGKMETNVEYIKERIMEILEKSHKK